MMKYPIGIQNFGEVRRGGFAYVDKTALIYKMASEGKYYFLSRPRRFGKSLLLSTMESYFSGEKELFCGLALERLEQEWLTTLKRNEDMRLSIFSIGVLLRTIPILNVRFADLFLQISIKNIPL